MFNFKSILKILQFLKSLLFLIFENLILFIVPSCKKTFAGEIVLITGSANGIGRHVALNFAPLGATLVLWDVDDEGNKETSRLAQKIGAKRVFPYHCDCTNKEEVYEQADKVRKEVGDVTILINNAGILLGKKFCDVPDEDFEKSLKVNFFSQVWTCKAFLPAMMTCNRGHLVSIASAAGLLGLYRMSDYAASKCAIIGMMEAIASELYHAGKQGIKTTIICPYFTNTKLAKGFQCQNPLLLPVYDVEGAAGKIMDAIQKEKFYLIMPLTLHFLAFKILIPRKMILLFESCFKITNSLDKAFGRKENA
ncbi:epidermal retinol dehydrogenase 2-like [Falco biarmicus]|uniref:epidermal retinol dehydrogenase 2-like n=1 Tax=Falco peregrinus TaxID=8954 RepID=UPI0003872B58|nr:epidermal retinol dehydrogenase 2-like [Falco peregrinus]XP_056188157.1 epidermal retinol dehydrogenase 2-like [Falco biarmicus]